MLAFQKLFTLAYKLIAKPLVMATTPDNAHEKMLSFGQFCGKIGPLMGLLNFATHFENEILEVNTMGLQFKNPLGLGAGMDKKLQLKECLRNIGLSHATFGSISRYPSNGNPRPWFHRLPELESMVVHVGLANDGIEATLSKLLPEYKGMKFSVSLALTNDPNHKQTLDEAIREYCEQLELVHDKVSMVEINISCPNAQLGEIFTEAKNLKKLLSALDKTVENFPNPLPITLKMPCFVSDEQFLELCKVASKHSITGLTIANLRKSRTGIQISDDWQGNLSGKPTIERSNYLISLTYKNFADRFCIIGLGGVSTAAEAYEKIKCGATLIQFVSSLVYTGPQVGAEIKRGLVKLLRQDGYTNVMQAVGANITKKDKI